MAMISVSVTVTAVDNITATFAKPAGSYKKTYPAPTVTDAGGPVAAIFAGADVDNGDGTMTATINFTGLFTGSVDFVVYDSL